MTRILLISFVLLLTSISAAQEFTLAYDHTALRVSDLERSGTFYSEVLQLQEIDIPYENPILKWYSLGGPYQLHLIEMTDQEVQPDIATHLALYVTDLDALIAHLEKNKVPYRDWVGKPQKIALRPDGIKQIYVQDPDGHWIEINDASH